MAKNIIKLTESKLKKLIKEAVQTTLDQEREWHEYIQQEKKVLEELLNTLTRNGIQTAQMSEYRSGLPVIAISTDEWHNSNAYEIARKFAEARGMYVKDDFYPATTYIKLEKIYH